MATLAAVLIVCNEAHNIEAALQSVQFADEIIVMDSGSTDDTVAIAKHYTDKVFTESDWQGYGVQRQRAQEKASADWVLMIDADERATPELQAEIKKIIASNDQTRVYAVPRLSWCFGRFIRHSGWYPDYVVRLYPRTQADYDAATVHEKLSYPPTMQLHKLRGDLLHYTYRDLQHYLVKSAAYAAAWAAQREQQGKRSNLLQGILHGVGCFVKMYIVRLGFLDGRQGLLLALLSAHSTFVKYADLWLRGNVRQ